MRSAGQVAPLAEKRNRYRILVGKLEGGENTCKLEA